MWAARVSDAGGRGHGVKETGSAVRQRHAVWMSEMCVTHSLSHEIFEGGEVGGISLSDAWQRCALTSDTWLVPSLSCHRDDLAQGDAISEPSGNAAPANPADSFRASSEHLRNLFKSRLCQHLRRRLCRET